MAWGGSTGQVSQIQQKRKKEEEKKSKEQKKLRRIATSGGRMTPQKRRALKKLGYKGTTTGATRAKFGQKPKSQTKKTNKDKIKVKTRDEISNQKKTKWHQYLRF